MTRNTYLALPALALAGGLVLTACGQADSDTTSTGSSSSEHGSGHSADGSIDSTADANDADVSFLTGMTPHHEQAVEMSEIILAKNPGPEVASIASTIKDAQAPEIEKMEAMLSALGEEGSSGEHSGEHSGGHGGGHGGGHSGGHGGMMSEEFMAALESATGTEAGRLYLEGMVEHHRGAIDASDTEIADGTYGPAIELAKQIKQAQAAEILEMQALLETL